MILEFKRSEPLSLGVELELQLVNTRDWNLTRGASDLLAAVKKAKHPGEIKPEITESMMMAHPERAAETLLEIKEMGVHISIDDFGTGYSSLARLKQDLDDEFGRFRWAFQAPELRTRRAFLRNAAFHRAAKTPG